MGSSGWRLLNQCCNLCGMAHAGQKKSHPYSEKKAFSKSVLRSAITNGTRLLDDVDHRLPEMRRLRDLNNDMVADLGGMEQLSTAEQVLVRRAAMLTLLCELYERYWFQVWQDHPWKLPAKETVINYQMTSNTLRRLLLALGLERRSRDVTPTLDQYLHNKGRQVAREAAE